MAKSSDFGEVNFDIRGGGRSSESSAPFRILILGDFSGRAPAGRARLSDRRPVLVDRDNFDDVMAKMSVDLALPGISSTPLRFAELDDFHPDRLFVRAGFFQKLRELRARLADPSTFPEAARELGVDLASQARARQDAPAAAPPDVGSMLQTTGASLLEDTIGATEVRSGGAAPARKTDDLAAFVRRAVEPHLVSKANPKQAELLGVIDQATGTQMRALLHLPAFQALEAAWRAVDLLVRRVETDASLKMYLWDVSKQELEEDLASKQDLSAAQTYKALVERTGTFGGEPWALLMGNYTFGRGGVDLLARLAQLARAAGAPFIAGGELDLLGCKSAVELNDWRNWRDWSSSSEAALWSALRRDGAARYVGLVLPRFLLRLPYGKETDAATQFNFEEISGSPEHDEYLWGNSAFLCTCLLAQVFAQDQWSMRPEESLDVGGLPLHIYKDHGEAVAKPCAETLLTEQAAVRVLDSGIMPLASLKDADAVRLVRLQSIANPVKALSGRWQ